MAQKSVNPISILKSIYHSEFQWSVLKSLGIFLIGVRMAKEFAGVEIMPAIAQH
ncbi:PREDICTED: uncharacterized protein LOC108357175 [Rhagoletis zephyria]|uniref:uncharacterized protein LOC108357175 n=1 Tax=Rhagoletis zephyria TaxID=28612 RepID=UPI000811218F|nr:PREDICTED: uncharacterized protein LOC108357175 [Rhagoletis zephyria]XP_036344523.1 uncharacterized protein LOC118753752 [Rhagoletis pomonella]